jgi:hypothetical protein
MESNGWNDDSNRSSSTFRDFDFCLFIAYTTTSTLYIAQPEYRYPQVASPYTKDQVDLDQHTKTPTCPSPSPISSNGPSSSRPSEPVYVLVPSIALTTQLYGGVLVAQGHTVRKARAAAVGSFHRIVLLADSYRLLRTWRRWVLRWTRLTDRNGCRSNKQVDL